MGDRIGAARPVTVRAALIGLLAAVAGCAGVGGGPDPASAPVATQAPSSPRPAPPAVVPAASANAATPIAQVPKPAPAAEIVTRVTPDGPSPSFDPSQPITTVEPARDRAAAPGYTDVWQRLRAGFAMPELPTPLVAEKERFYLAQRDALQRMLARGSPYLHFIVEEVERRGMPTELALLPFVESAMNPVALSPASAAGLWQFIPATGRRFELSQNWWVDNRRDVVKSTRAALEYLQIIYEMHGNDWFLALASYNWGEGAVGRAVKRAQARGLSGDYLSLAMPNETRHYVPKLIALKHIVMRADELGVVLPPIPNRPYFATIEKTRPIDLKLAAQFAGMSVEEFLALNPAHNRPVIAASRNNQIRLPADRVDTFLKAVERHDRQSRPLASWQPYTLQPGETLDDVARRGNVTTTELLKANGLAAGRRILPGTQVLAPQASVRDEMKVESFEGPKVYEHVAVPAVYHRVGRHETMNSIAASYGLGVEQLRAWNGGAKAARPGTSLLVRRATTQTVLTTAGGARQVVARSDAAVGNPEAPPVARGSDPQTRTQTRAAAPPPARSIAPKVARAKSAPNGRTQARAAAPSPSVKAVYRPPRASATKPPAAPKRPRT